jgi:hypothetical protein
MKRISLLFLSLALAPASSAAQEDLTQRLTELLPAEVSAQVLERIESARTRDLPDRAMASLALEGVAKGRSGADVLEAVEALGIDLGRAHEALQASDRAPLQGEVESATAAMRLGVDGTAVSELASGQPSGRSLVVPLLVLGGLVDRGLPSDEAIAAVRARLAEGVGDGELVESFPGVGRELGLSMIPANRGPAAREGVVGIEIPVAGVPVSIPSQGRPGPGGA